MSQSKGFIVAAGNVKDCAGYMVTSFTLKACLITLQIANLESAVLGQASRLGSFVPKFVWGKKSIILAWEKV